MYNSTEVLQMVYLPDGVISDYESIVVDVAVDPGFEVNDYEHYVQDSSLDEEEFVKIAQTGQNHLNVEVYQPPEPHDENPDDVNAATNEAESPPGPSVNSLLGSIGNLHLLK